MVVQWSGGNVTADTPADLKDDYALWANKDRILRMEIPKGFIGACNSTDVVMKGIECVLSSVFPDFQRAKFRIFSLGNSAFSADQYCPAFVGFSHWHDY